MSTNDTGLQPDPLMTTAGTAAYLNVPARWIYNHLDELPHLRLGRGLRFRRRELDRWLDAHRGDHAGLRSGGI